MSKRKLNIDDDNPVLSMVQRKHGPIPESRTQYDSPSIKATTTFPSLEALIRDVNNKIKIDVSTDVDFLRSQLTLMSVAFTSGDSNSFDKYMVEIVKHFVSSDFLLKIFDELKKEYPFLVLVNAWIQKAIKDGGLLVA